MQHNQDQWNRNRRSDFSNHLPTFLYVFSIIAVVFVGLALRFPSVSEWISAAAQAEFVGPNLPDVAPTQIAEPAEHMRTIRTD